MDNELVKDRLKMLLKLVEETQPDIIDKNYLFQPHHWQVQNWIEQLEEGDELLKPSDVMKDANAMWSFRNRFKSGELDKNNWPVVEIEEQIKEFLIKNQKINAIKCWRNHKLDDMKEECTLRDAKEYIDSLHQQYIRLGII
jgi:hypothetical protein